MERQEGVKKEEASFVSFPPRVGWENEALGPTRGSTRLVSGHLADATLSSLILLRPVLIVTETIISTH